MNSVTAPQARVISVEDVQNRADTRRIPINQVGIKDINHPVKVKDRSAGEQHTVANFNMYVNLPHNFKGTHMSRFVEILHREREISVESFGALLAEMTERLEADSGEAFRQHVGPQRHRCAHDRHRQRIADTGGVTAQQIELQLGERVVRDAHVGEVAEAGVDAVDRRVLLDGGVHHGACGADARPRAIGQRHRRVVVGDGNQIVERQ